eukprot:8947824-Pyramimonas_sp.AAC.1
MAGFPHRLPFRLDVLNGSPTLQGPSDFLPAKMALMAAMQTSFEYIDTLGKSDGIDPGTLQAPRHAGEEHRRNG